MSMHRIELPGRRIVDRLICVGPHRAALGNGIEGLHRVLRGLVARDRDRRMATDRPDDHDDPSLRHPWAGAKIVCRGDDGSCAGRHGLDLSRGVGADDRRARELTRVDQPTIAELDGCDLVGGDHLAHGLVMASEDRGNLADGEEFWGHRQCS